MHVCSTVTIVVITLVTLSHGYSVGTRTVPKTMEGTPSISPGIKARISRRGIEYAAFVGTKMLRTQIENINIADQKGSKNLKIGSVDHILTNIRIQSFTPPHTTVSLKPFTWVLEGISLHLTADWAYDYRAFSFFTMRDHGSMEIYVSVDFQMTLTLTRSAASGRMRIATHECACDVTEVDIDFEDAWLYNVFDSIAERYLKQQLRWQVCHEAQVVLNEKANAELASMPLLLALRHGVMVDYSLTQSPAFNHHYIDVLFTGSFYCENNTADPYQISAAPIPEASPDQDLHMVGFWLTEYSLNTLAVTAYRLGLLQTYITRDDLFATEAFMFQTTCDSFFAPCFGLLVPQADELYPNSLIEVKVAASKPPVFKISPSGIVTNLSVVAEFYAVQENSTTKDPPPFLFSINVQTLFNMTVELDGMRLKGKPINFELGLITLNRTDIGDVSVGFMNIVMNLCMLTSVVPRVDFAGQEGVPLPSVKDVVYVNPQLRLLEHAIYAGMDARYKF